MPPTTGFRRGDVVLVGFIFSDESGVKKRPGVVLSSEAYHRNRQEAIIAAVTGNVDRLLTGDYRIARWREAGFLYPSTATGIIRTIKQSMIHRKLGTLSSQDLRGVEAALRQALTLPA